MTTGLTPESDGRLDRELRQWALEAPLPPRFQEQVWNRITQAEARRKPSVWGAALRAGAELFLRPRFAFAYVTVLLLVGIASGIWMAQVKRSRMDSLLGERYVQSIAPYPLVVARQ